MPKYVVYYQAAVSTGVEVEASDEEAAREKADEIIDLPYGLCSYCTDSVGDLSDWQQIEADYGVYEIEE